MPQDDPAGRNLAQAGHGPAPRDQPGHRRVIVKAADHELEIPVDKVHRQPRHGCAPLQAACGMAPLARQKALFRASTSTRIRGRRAARNSTYS